MNREHDRNDLPLPGPGYDILIHHSPLHGVIVNGNTKPFADVIKSGAWLIGGIGGKPKYSRDLDAWYVPNTRGTPHNPVLWDEARELFESAGASVEFEELPRLRESEQDVMARKTDRDMARAERYQGYSESARSRSDSAYQAAHEMADQIPMGQPILVGHHSERRARRDADKIASGMRKSISEGEKAEYYKDKAERSRKRASGLEGEKDSTIENRIKKSQARIRKIDRWIERSKPTGISLEKFLVEKEILQERIQINQEELTERRKDKPEQSASLLDPKSYKPGDSVWVGRIEYVVIRPNAKTITGYSKLNLTISAIGGEVEKVRYDHIDRHEPAPNEYEGLKTLAEYAEMLETHENVGYYGRQDAKKLKEKTLKKLAKMTPTKTEISEAPGMIHISHNIEDGTIVSGDTKPARHILKSFGLRYSAQAQRNKAQSRKGEELDQKGNFWFLARSRGLTQSNIDIVALRNELVEKGFAATIVDDSTFSHESRPTTSGSISLQLNQMADRMDKSINADLSPAIGDQRPTMRRVGIAKGMMERGQRNKELQAVIRRLADWVFRPSLMDTYPILTRLRLKKDIEWVFDRYRMIVSAMASNPDLNFREACWKFYPSCYFFVRDLEEVLSIAKGTKGLKRVAAKLEKSLESYLDFVRREYSGARDRVERAKANEFAERWDFAAGRDDYQLVKKIQSVLRKKPGWNSIDHNFRGIENCDYLERLGINHPDSFVTLMGRFGEIVYDVAVRGIEHKPDPELAKKELKATTIRRIPGFFPTPSDVVRKMISNARIDSNSVVLEPSAGAGDIAEAVAKLSPAILHVVEFSQQLSDYLISIGLDLVGRDFLEFEPEVIYDRILMNPPFEKGQAWAHIARAYDILAPGGVLVSVIPGRMIPSAQIDKMNLTDSQKDEIRHLTVTQNLPSGSFRESGTNVETSLIVIDKPVVATVAQEHHIEDSTTSKWSSFVAANQSVVKNLSGITEKNESKLVGVGIESIDGVMHAVYRLEGPSSMIRSALKQASKSDSIVDTADKIVKLRINPGDEWLSFLDIISSPERWDQLAVKEAPKTAKKVKPRGRTPRWSKVKKRTKKWDRTVKAGIKRTQKKLRELRSQPETDDVLQKIATAEAYMRRADEYMRLPPPAAKESPYRPMLPSGTRPRLKRSQSDCSIAQEMAIKLGCKIAATGGKIYDSEGNRYSYSIVAVPKQEIISSHDPFSFALDSRYDQDFQARDRMSDESRLQVYDLERTFDYERFLQSGPTPTEGMPIALPTRDGFQILAGNGRYMAFIRSLEKRGSLDYEKLCREIYGVDLNGSVMLRVVDISREDAVKLAANSQRSGSSRESTTSKSIAAVRDVGWSDYWDLPSFRFFLTNSMPQMLTAKNVGVFESENSTFVKSVYPSVLPASPEQRAEKYISVLIGLLPESTQKWIGTFGYPLEEFFAGFTPYLAAYHSIVSHLDDCDVNDRESLCQVFNPMVSIEKISDYIFGLGEISAVQVETILRKEIETPSMFGQSSHDFSATDLAWLSAILRAAKTRNPRFTGAELGQRLQVAIREEVDSMRNQLFGYEPDKERLMVRVVGKKSYDYGRRLAVQARKNPSYLLLGNPKPLDARATTMIKNNPGKSRSRRVKISSLPDSVKNDPEFQAAMQAITDRYGSKPTHVRPVKAPPGSATYLAAIGDLQSISYLAADAEGEPVDHWIHEARDNGEGEAKSKRPAIVAYDPIHDDILLTLPGGADMTFTDRGIKG